MLRTLAGYLLLTLFAPTVLAVQPNLKSLPIDKATDELFIVPFVSPLTTTPPYGKVQALGEWENSQAVLVVWPHAPLIEALAARTKVILLADDKSAIEWWKRWLKQNKIASTNISYFEVETNSIWVRDYGPWFIVDGKGQLGIVDTIYNRPRPLDDQVPEFIANWLNIPLYKPGIIHTGGNFYSDGVGNAFSSTLVYTENPAMTHAKVDQTMNAFLGITNYTTSQLAPRITIEHIDTFGKLVTPDTFVFAQFEESSRYYADTEAMVKKIKTLKSPYGTPYKIFRLNMSARPGSYSEDYRAYINAFVSNNTLYVPGYDDDGDNYAREVFQKALPGYEIVMVPAKNTEWGDSIHCRTRNIFESDTIFIFPEIPYIPGNEKRPIEILVSVIPSPGANLIEEPQIHWQINNSRVRTTKMTHIERFTYKSILPAQPIGSVISLYIEANDSNGHHKVAPAGAPNLQISFYIN